MIGRVSFGARKRRSAVGLRVGLFGLLGTGNIGNDGSLRVMLTYLRRQHPDAVLDALCAGPERITERFGLPAVPLNWNHREYQTASSAAAVARKVLGKFVDALRIASWVRGHDVVIMPGMGALEATLPLRPWGTPYSVFLLCAFGRLFGTKVALVSVGANVVREPCSRRLLLAAARRAYYLSYRDVQSRDAMRQVGLRERGDDVYPDLVFSLPTPACAPALTGAVGLGIMDYHGGNDDRHRADELHREYVSAMKRFVRWLIDGGRSVRLFTGDLVDQPVVQEILADLREQRPGLHPSRIVAEPVGSLEDLMQQIASVDTMVATRFHNVLCALKLAKPTLSLGYAAKNEALMASMGLGEYCQNVDSIDFDRLLEQFTMLESRRAELTRVIVERARANEAHLDQQFATLSAVLFSADRSAPVQI
jgi:polysaccharide pyruvyl transferase WcaK-like protein